MFKKAILIGLSLVSFLIKSADYKKGLYVTAITTLECEAYFGALPEGRMISATYFYIGPRAGSYCVTVDKSSDRLSQNVSKDWFNTLKAVHGLQNIK